MNILITGSSTGIGLAAALHLAGKGHRVFASLRDPSNAPELRQGIERGLPLSLVRIDVDDDASVASGVAEVIAAAGKIDVLVNNAGVGASGPLEMVPLEVARQLFETNYFGAIRMIRAVVPAMRERRSGMVINVTSVAGLITAAAHGHYSASKYALEAASESLALELAPYGVRVAMIEPGVILTPIFTKNRQVYRQGPEYQAAVRRLHEYFAKQLECPQSPELVARTIAHAIETDDPKMRYLVGNDAEALVAARWTASDEEWLHAHATEDDDEYYSRLEALAHRPEE